jgi:hypothetical protein
LLRALVFFSLITSVSASRLFPVHFARIFVFPDSKKYRLPQTIIPGPLREFHLADHYRFDPTATFHFGGG